MDPYAEMQQFIRKAGSAVCGAAPAEDPASTFEAGASVRTPRHAPGCVRVHHDPLVRIVLSPSCVPQFCPPVLYPLRVIRERPRHLLDRGPPRSGGTQLPVREAYAQWQSSCLRYPSLDPRTRRSLAQTRSSVYRSAPSLMRRRPTGRLVFAFVHPVSPTGAYQPPRRSGWRPRKTVTRMSWSSSSISMWWRPSTIP